jgi:hypothetical protein
VLIQLQKIAEVEYSFQDKTRFELNEDCRSISFQTIPFYLRQLKNISELSDIIISEEGERERESNFDF